jgi:meso-butanediol dehydrogenase/(S,S)-butanediol dehydrogenase/diacetyl reductase
MRRLEGKAGLVTGAAGGIGEAIVRAFLDEGARVMITDLKQEAVDALAAELGENAAGAVVDVTSYEQVAAGIDATVEAFGRFDVMVNNAGFGVAKPLLDHDPRKDWDSQVAVNQRGVYHGILAAGRKFRELEQTGVILNTSSVYGTVAAELSFTYNATKAAVDMMTKSAALELGPHGIRVVAVAPGRVDTPLLREYEKLGLWEHIRREQMRGEFTEPAEIGNVFAFLASDAANCINGTTIYADDGFTSFKYPLLPSE